jgi:hypothetical protein
VIGAVIIVVGLYCLIWGKSKDHLGSNGKPGAAAVAGELPLTSAPTANNGSYGKHAALGGGHHVVTGVETTPPPPPCVPKCVH